MRREDLLHRDQLETGIVVTTLLLSLDEIENSPLRSSPIIRVIMEEGVSV
jgi:hypothetical protein